MAKYRCKECGRIMTDGKDFCSKKCSRENRRKQLASTKDGPAMPLLDADSIADEGYIAIVKALVSRSSQDVTNYKPGTQIRVSAEEFFESDHFTALTGLNGKPILRKLKKEYERKHKHNRPRKYQARQVRCVETGAVYESAYQAGEVFSADPNGICKSCRRGTACTGLHFEYVEARK